MACCAMPGGCNNPTCYMCVVMPKKFPKQPPTSAELDRRKSERAELRETKKKTTRSRRK